MRLVRQLANLGYGTRREVEDLLRRQRVTRRDGSVVREGDVVAHADLRVDGEPLDPPPGAVILLHKPTGLVCSAKEDAPLVYDILPPRFRRRSPIMAPIGRLDADTSGLLLLTDDGQVNHRLASPKTHVPKVYEARLASDLRGDEGALFASGTLVLHGEATPLRPAALDVLGPRVARLTLHEGRYHQVRRMFAATGNHVVALHRRSLGGLELGDLAAGAWRELSAVERATLLP